MNSDDKNTERDGLLMSRRQTSILVVTALALICVAFLSGYFVGKRQAMEQFVTRLEQDSFADQVYASLCELYDYDSESIREEEGDENGCGEPESTEVSAPAIDLGTSTTMTQQGTRAFTMLDQKTIPRYYAQLLGYRTNKEAKDFVAKLAKKHIDLEIRDRKSVTARGKVKEWYQVVTKKYTDRTALQELVTRVGREEKIKGIQIVTCS